MQNAGLRAVGLAILALRPATGAAGAVRRDGPRAARRRVPRRERDDPPQGGRAGGGRRGQRRARATGAANTLCFEPDGRSTPTTPTRPALIAALPFAVRRAERARARRGWDRSLGGVGAARRRRGGGAGLESHPGAGRAAGGRISERRRSTASSRRICSCTARRVDWMGWTRRSSALPVAADDL